MKGTMCSFHSPSPSASQGPQTPWDSRDALFSEGHLWLDFVIFILSLKVELLLAFVAVPSPEARLGFPPASSVELLHLISGHSAG